MKNNILLNKLKAVKSFFKLPFVTYKNLEEKIEEMIGIDNTITSLETDLSNIEDRFDDKMNIEDFNYELSQDYDFMELKDQVEELQDNSELSYNEISDESHCISQLIDERNEGIISMITEIENRVDQLEKYRENHIELLQLQKKYTSQIESRLEIAEQNLAVKTEQMEKVYYRLKNLESQSREIQISKPIEVKLIKD